MQDAMVEQRDATPTLVYDDDCGFCTWCTEWAVRHGSFTPVGFTELTPDQRALLPDDYEACAHLLTDEDVFSCGASIEQTLARVHPVLWWVFEGLRRVPGYPWLRERLYRWVADHRAWWGKLVSAEPPIRR